MKRSLGATLLLLTAPILLGACSSDAENEAVEDTVEADVAPEDDDLGPGIADVPQPAPADPEDEDQVATIAPEETEDPSSAPEGTPTREEVVDGLSTMMMAELGLSAEELEESGTAEIMNEFYLCVTDAVYDTTSHDALVALAQADLDAELSQDDTAILNQATIDCGNAVGTP